MTSTNSQAHHRGRHYEHIAAQTLTALGYKVTMHDETSSHDHDLIVNGVAVEVKGSQPYSYNGNRHAQGFGFAIKRINGAATTCPVVILVCVIDDPVLFVIPRSDLNGAHMISIPNRNPCAYKGKWSTYLGRFDLLDREIHKHQLLTQGGQGATNQVRFSGF